MHPSFQALGTYEVYLKNKPFSKVKRCFSSLLEKDRLYWELNRGKSVVLWIPEIPKSLLEGITGPSKCGGPFYMVYGSKTRVFCAHVIEKNENGC